MRPLTSTARMTGLFYLGLGITGILGFLLIRPQLFDADDPNATLANVIENEALARAGVALELGIVLTQALVAIWFYRLFRSANPVGAATIAAFGLVNAGAILGSAAALATAVQVATEPIGDTATTVQLLHMISANLWGAGALFFGLWMIPMGGCVIGTRWMPRPLGWLLVAGGGADRRLVRSSWERRDNAAPGHSIGSVTGRPGCDRTSHPAEVSHRSQRSPEPWPVGPRQGPVSQTLFLLIPRGCRG